MGLRHEAALLTKAMDGAPVKVVWTREDDIHHGFYHTVTAERIEAGLDKDNKVVAWRQRSAAPSIFANFMPDPKYPQFIELGLGFVDTPFNVPMCGWRAERRSRTSGSAGSDRSTTSRMRWRSSRSSPKSRMSSAAIPRTCCWSSSVRRGSSSREKATTPWWDYGEPFDVYPIDTGRLRRVAELVAEKADWGKKLPKGHGLGIAAHRSFVSYVATVVEVAVDDKGNFSVPRVDTAIDCGFASIPSASARRSKARP